MTATRALVCLALAFVPAMARASFDPTAMRQKYVAGATYQGMGYTGAEVRDVDGRPGQELLIGYTNMWQLLRWDDRAATFAQVGFFENDYGSIFGGGGGLATVRLAEIEHGAPMQVVALGEDGSIGRFDVDGTLHLPLWKPVSNAVWMFVADVDGQPGDEIILKTCSDVTAWKFGGTAPLWRIPIGSCQPVLLAQLDRDPQLELVLGSGTVIDTKTLQTQWRYPIGFGAFLAAADIDGDGVNELIGCDGRQCDAFDVLRQTTIWETFLDYPWTVGALAAADVDGDGRAELFEGDSQHGFVRKIDGRTGMVLQQFSKSGGANFVLVADLNGDCRKEVIWAKDGDNTAIDTFHVTDAVTMKTVWSSVPEESGSSGLAVADFAGNGHPSILWPSRGSSVARFVSFDPPAQTNIERDGSYDGYALYLPLAAAAQLDSDAAAEYVLPFNVRHIGPTPDGIGVYDGATRALQWSLAVVPAGDTLSSMTAGDLNGDGVPDIVVGTGIEYTPADHPEGVVAVDGATHQILWRTTDQLTHLLGQHCEACVVEVRVADLAQNGSRQVVAFLPSDGLYAFDGRTGALLWHSLLGVPDEIGTLKALAFTVADVDPSPGAEVIVALPSRKIAVFDSTASTLLRSVDVSSFGAAWALDVADLDGDGVAELIAVTEGGLVVFSADKLALLWSGGFVLPLNSLGNQIAVADVDGDGSPEIIVPSAHSLRIFEYRRTAADAAAPRFDGRDIHLVTSSGCCRTEFTWDAASDAVSMPVHYRVYRSSVSGFTPTPALRVAETAATTFVDRQLVAGQTSYYAVTAVDSAGNESSDALRISAVALAECPPRPHAARTF